MKSKDYVIFDLDGCLSDDGWRQRFLPPKGTKDQNEYDNYHRRCAADKVMNFASFKRMTSGATPIFITARPLRLEYTTRKWIEEKLGYLDDYFLRMRPSEIPMTSPEFKSQVGKNFIDSNHHVIAAFDDRIDVLEAYNAVGIQNCYQLNKDGLGVKIMDEPSPRALDAGDVLQEMITTFKERNAVYKDNYRKVPELVKVLFPEGVPPDLVEQVQWHLFELILVKLTRFTQSELTHVDSIHDIAVHAAMIEAAIREAKK